MITIGSDEVGWGAVAGPLYVVGVAMPTSWSFPGLRDSKKYTGKAGRQRREALFEPLIDEVRGRWALASRTPEELDLLGAQHCLVGAHTEVLQRLLGRIPMTEHVDRVIVDGNLRLPEVKAAISIPKADDKFQVVSAASVLAKVLRDNVMIALAATYPQYGFITNAGYESPEHTRALKKYGLCPAHRRSYLKTFVST